jgi:hypothetical protein
MMGDVSEMFAFTPYCVLHLRLTTGIVYKPSDLKRLKKSELQILAKNSSVENAMQ